MPNQVITKILFSVINKFMINCRRVIYIITNESTKYKKKVKKNFCGQWESTKYVLFDRLGLNLNSYDHENLI